MDTVLLERHHTHHPFSGNRQDHATGKGRPDTGKEFGANYGLDAARRRRAEIHERLSRSELAGASPREKVAIANAILAEAGYDHWGRETDDEPDAFTDYYDMDVHDDRDLDLADPALNAEWLAWLEDHGIEDITLADQVLEEAARAGDPEAIRILQARQAEAEGRFFATLADLGAQAVNPFRQVTFLDQRELADQWDRDGEGLVGFSVRRITAQHVR